MKYLDGILNPRTITCGLSINDGGGVLTLGNFIIILHYKAISEVEALGNDFKEMAVLQETKTATPPYQG